MTTKYVGCVGHKDGHIETLRVWSGAWVTKARVSVIAEIEQGTTHKTWAPDSTGTYAAGAEVRVIHVNGSKYLRTDRNQVARDNLDHLPAMGVCPF